MSIALSTPPQITSVLGSMTKVAYDKMILHSINLDPIRESLSASISLFCTADPDMQVIGGTLGASVLGKSLDIQVPQLDFYRKLALNTTQATALKQMIYDAEDDVETRLISLGLVDGAHSSGP